MPTGLLAFSGILGVRLKKVLTLIRSFGGTCDKHRWVASMTRGERIKVGHQLWLFLWQVWSPELQTTRGHHLGLPATHNELSCLDIFYCSFSGQESLSHQSCLEYQPSSGQAHSMQNQAAQLLKSALLRARKYFSSVQDWGPASSRPTSPLQRHPK